MVRILFVLLLVSPVIAEAAGARTVVETLYVDDSESAKQHAHYLGYRFNPRLAERDDSLVLSLGIWDFDDPAGSEEFKAIRARYETPLMQHTRLHLRASVLDGERWNPELYGATLAHDIGEKWHLEAYADRELVDSVPAIDQELLLDSFGASADYVFSPQWTLVGAAFHHSINDGNDRDGALLRLIYTSPGGFSVQTRSRYIESDFDGVGYFSPPELEEHLLLLGYTRALLGDRWVVSVQAGPGRQRFEDDSGDTTRNDLFHAELKARGWFTEKVGLEVRGFCSNTGGPSASVPDDDYRYCNALASLLFAW